MVFPIITHHGATQGVTGSCHQLHLDAQCSVLIDCGLFQGVEASTQPYPVIDFPVERLKALVVTHVHLDHVGRIPDLLAAGYRGPILCSVPSAKLLPVVLEDAMKVSGRWSPDAIERCLRLLSVATTPLAFDEWHDIADVSLSSCRVRLQRAGHLLGSAYVEFDIQGPQLESDCRVVFSGDLGAGSSALLRQSHSPERADILVLESTYGDRLHAGSSTRRRRLEQVIERALVDRGTVLIPAFSIGRTQELLFELEGILHDKALLMPDTGAGQVASSTQLIDWPQLPVILDSPLAGRLTQIYRDLGLYWNEDARQRLAQGRCPFSFRQLISIDSHQQHQQVVNYLGSTGRPAIVIAGNGMCTSGRVVNYLKAMLGDSRHEVVFTGYQARGTPGAVIQASEGAEGFVMVDLDGEMREIKAKVTTVGGYSAHADQAGLVEFVAGIPRWAGRILLVYGGASAKQALAVALRPRGAERGVLARIEVPDGRSPDGVPGT
ncbi:MBL fold metallo-hydrolase [Pseudomonas sp. Marseille-P9899]|uniref:MBL fold metallo-hydrolase n=1 Tax=Pseudomonas sp. Marseille-P9899 TaxID=2730401 RepID=UPI00158D0C56|nr:MBL fold metallo-hydrolase [Pseudomonas sp. Marseille-P9899]